jgi:hypothetical protein
MAGIPPPLQAAPPPPPPPPPVEPTEKFFNFRVEDLNVLRKKGKSQRHAIKKAKGITSDLIKAAKGVIQKAIEISKQGATNTGSLISALRTDFRKDVFNILKTGTDSLLENFEEKFSDKWVSEITDHIDANETIYKNIMMERVAPVMKKIITLMDPIQALGYTDDQKVELAIDASIAIPNSIFIAGITMYSKSLPLVMRLTGLIPPVIIANLETTLSTIICIFNNLKRFQKLEKGQKPWKAIGETQAVGNAPTGEAFKYTAKKISSGDFWQCDSPGLKIDDQNRRAEKEQWRQIKAGNARDERKKKAEEMKKNIEKDNAASDKYLGKVKALQKAKALQDLENSP